MLPRIHVTKSLGFYRIGLSGSIFGKNSYGSRTCWFARQATTILGGQTLDSSVLTYDCLRTKYIYPLSNFLVFSLKKSSVNMLYLGAASGTTMTHVYDIVGPVSSLVMILTIFIAF